MRFLRLLAACALLVMVVSPASAVSALTLTPDPIAFGKVPVGQSEVRTVRAINDTSAPVTVTGLTVVGLQVLSSTCTEGLALAAGAECAVVVQWQPTAPGPLTGTVAVTTEAGQQVVVATGNAVAPLRLSVLAHGKTLRIRQQAQLIKKITTNGQVTKAAVWCSYLGKRLPAAFARRACGLRVKGSGRNLTAQARPLCTEDVTLRARVTASSGVDRQTWQRTWRVFVRPQAGGRPNEPICATMGERFA